LLVTLRRCRRSRRNVCVSGERRSRWHDDPSKKKRNEERRGTEQRKALRTQPRTKLRSM